MPLVGHTLGHCYSRQTPLLLGYRTFTERTGSTGGTLPGMLLAVAMKLGEGEHLHRGRTGRCLLGLTFHQLIVAPKQYQQGLPSVARTR